MWIPAPRFREDKLRGNDSRGGSIIAGDTGIHAVIPMKMGIQVIL